MKKKVFLWVVGLILAGLNAQAIDSYKELLGRYTVTSFTGIERGVFTDDGNWNQFEQSGYDVMIVDDEDCGGDGWVRIYRILTNAYDFEERIDQDWIRAAIHINDNEIVIEGNWTNWHYNHSYSLYYDSYIDDEGNEVIYNEWTSDNGNIIGSFDENGVITFDGTYGADFWDGNRYIANGTLVMEPANVEEGKFHYASYDNPWDLEGRYNIVELEDGTRLNCLMVGGYWDRMPSIVEIATDSVEITLPENIEIEGETYNLQGLGQQGDNQYLFAQAPNLKKINVPANVGLRICANIDEMGSNLSEMWFGSAIPMFDYGHSTYKIYCMDRENYRDFLNMIPDALQGWETIKGEITVPTPGDFAYLYLTATGGNWGWYDELKVIGELNDADIACFRNLTLLRKLDLSEAIFVNVPGEFVANSRDYLREVVLPSTVTRIEDRGFYYCSDLNIINLENVEYIGQNAFYNCDRLTSVYLPKAKRIEWCAFNSCDNLRSVILESVENIFAYAFQYCPIETIQFPSTLKRIEYEAFRYCRSLQSVEFNEGLEYIGDEAFMECNLTSVSLPASLTSMGNGVFNYNYNLNTVKCKSILPPETGNSIIGGVDVTNVTLHIAPCARELYRHAVGWSIFYLTQDLLDPIGSLTINRSVTLETSEADNPVFENVNIDLRDRADFTLNGNASINANNFNFYGKVAPYRENSANSGYELRSTFVNNDSEITAKRVATQLSFYRGSDYNRWYFISFPYDVNVDDITVEANGNEVFYAIREYDGAARAAGEGDPTWKNMEAGSVLKAYKGYIIKMSVPSGDYYTSPVFTFPSAGATDGFFAAGDVTVPLTEYPAEYSNNQSWNLVGNPYPAYVPFTAIDGFAAPITIWRGDNYQAYSPIDDDVILRPNEAFFVQCPEEVEGITFAADGRIGYELAMEMNQSYDVGTKKPAMNLSGREVFNVAIKGATGDDRARVVINEEAEMGYEVGRDASKFIADGSAAPQLFSVAGGLNYDINERALGDGIVALTAIIPADGSYTISLSGKYDSSYTVVLTDLATGKTVDLTSNDYEFEAGAGMQADRFYLTISNTGIDGIEDVKAELSGDANVTITAINGVTVYTGALSNAKVAMPGIYVITSENGSRKAFIK